MHPKSRIESSLDFNSQCRIADSIVQTLSHKLPMPNRRFNCYGGWQARRPKWRSLVTQSGQNENAFELKELVDELNGSVDWQEVYISL